MNEVSTEVIKCKYPALETKENLTVEDELFAEEMEALGDIKLKLPKIKLGASGNGKLEVPDPTSPDDTKGVRELVGVIVCATSSRAKWNEGDTIPECASSNGKVSLSGKQCATCKFCKFSRDENGKAVRPLCKESRNLFIVTEEHAMPLQFIIPPSGIAAYDTFARNILSSRQVQLGTIVKISVDVVTNNANQKYNKAKFESMGRVEADLLPKLMDLRKQIIDTISSSSMEDFVDDSTTMTELTGEDKENIDKVF